MPRTTITAVLLNPNADGRHTIYIRITKNRKPKYIGLDIAVKKEHFNPSAGIDDPRWISKKHPLSTAWNELIKAKLIEYDTHRHNKELKTSQEIKQIIVSPYDPNSFYDYFLKFAEAKRASNGIHSYNKYKAEANKFNACHPEAKFRDITYENLKKYESYLLTINNKNTTAKSLEFLKEVVKEAVKDDKIPGHLNPFLKFEIKQVKEVVSKAKQEAPSISEVSKLFHLPLMPGTNKCHSRNIFITQIYCMGARIGEMLMLKTEDIGPEYLEYEVEKKGTEIPIKKRVLITPTLRYIINQYYDKNNVFLFPFMEGTQLPDHKKLQNTVPPPGIAQDKLRALIKEENLQIKEKLTNKIKSTTRLINEHITSCCKDAEINSRPTTHSARHFVADTLKKSGMELSKIQEALGHGSEEETKNYLEIGAPIIVDINTTHKLIDLLESA